MDQTTAHYTCRREECKRPRGVISARPVSLGASIAVDADDSLMNPGLRVIELFQREPDYLGALMRALPESGVYFHHAYTGQNTPPIRIEVFDIFTLSQVDNVRADLLPLLLVCSGADAKAGSTGKPSRVLVKLRRPEVNCLLHWRHAEVWKL